jgi:alcohol dehydrogenase
MREEPMADVQKWIDELRAGKVVGRIILKAEAAQSRGSD